MQVTLSHLPLLIGEPAKLRSSRTARSPSLSSLPTFILREARLDNGVELEIGETRPRLASTLTAVLCGSAAAVAARVAATETQKCGQTRQIQEISEHRCVEEVGVGSHRGDEEIAQPLAATLHESRQDATSADASGRQSWQVALGLSQLAVERGKLPVTPEDGVAAICACDLHHEEDGTLGLGNALADGHSEGSREDADRAHVFHKADRQL